MGRSLAQPLDDRPSPLDGPSRLAAPAIEQVRLVAAVTPTADERISSRCRCGGLELHRSTAAGTEARSTGPIKFGVAAHGNDGRHGG